MTDISNKDIVVYTAISNDYDFLRDPPEVESEGCDYICFSDTKMNSSFWKIVSFPDNDLGPTRKCRKLKILPHKCFPNYDYSIWVDGNIDIIGDIRKLAEKEFKRGKLITFKHPKRDCIYDEAEVCLEKSKDDQKIIKKQMERYKDFDYPENFGLIESRVMLRKHNNEEVKKTMNDWWYEVANFSKRDQLSFNFVVWKNDFDYEIMEEHPRNSDNDYFSIRGHRQDGIKGMWQKIKVKRDKFFVYNLIYLFGNKLKPILKSFLRGGSNN